MSSVIIVFQVHSSIYIHIYFFLYVHIRIMKFGMRAYNKYLFFIIFISSFPAIQYVTFYLIANIRTESKYLAKPRYSVNSPYLLH